MGSRAFYSIETQNYKFLNSDKEFFFKGHVILAGGMLRTDVALSSLRGLEPLASQLPAVKLISS